MGLKDELVLANDPVEESEGTGSDNVSGEPELEPVNKSDDSGNNPETNNEQQVDVEESPDEPVVDTEVQEENVLEEEEEEEEEVEDPMDNLKEKCTETSAAQQLKAIMDECTERVSSKENTEETCAQELYDFVHKVDHCVAKTIFNHLK